MVRPCVKLWVVWPPTPANLTLFYRTVLDDANKGRPLRLARAGLAGGRVLLQDETLAVELPPGTIHVAVTLRGGVLLGKNFIPSCAAPVVEAVLAHELTVAAAGPHGGRDFEAHNAVAFFEACSLGAVDRNHRSAALASFCRRHGLISSLRPRGPVLDHFRAVEARCAASQGGSRRGTRARPPTPACLTTAAGEPLPICGNCLQSWGEHIEVDGGADQSLGGPREQAAKALLRMGRRSPISVSLS